MTLLILSFIIPSAESFVLIKNECIEAENISTVEWAKTYGGDRFEMLQCVQQVNDNGYIACGIKQAYDTEQLVYRPWVIKTDSSGNLEWEWILTEISYDESYFNYFEDGYCMFVEPTNDNCFLTGYSLLCTPGDDNFYWVGGLVKLDSSGYEVWSETCTDGDLEWSIAPHSVIEFDDGSFLIVGQSGEPNESNFENEACLYKINSMGIEQWRKEYSYGVNDNAWAVCETNDNGYLLTGWADSGANGNDIWLIKTDQNGNKLWEKTHGGSGDDFGHSRNSFQTSDNGFIFGGYTNSHGAGYHDAWIIKTDSTGNMQWNRTYGGKYNDGFWSFESNDDDSYVFCITKNISGYFGDSDDIHLVDIDSEGNIVWIQEFGGEGRQVGQHIDKTSDGGFIVSGRNGKYFNDESDGILVKFASFSNDRPDKPTIKGSQNGNPDEEYTFTASSTDSNGDTLQYMWDWGDGNYSDWLETSEASHTWTTEDNFKIRVIAKDIHSGESDWSDPFVFSTPKNKASNIPLFLHRILQRFPFMLKILNQII